MKLYLRGHSDRYAVEQLQRLTFTDEELDWLSMGLGNRMGAAHRFDADGRNGRMNTYLLFRKLR